MSSAITPADPRWHTALPRFRPPFAEESLPGYLLALDDLNGQPGGTTLWVAKRSDISVNRFCEPGPYIRAPWIDLGVVAEMAGGRDLAEIRSLTYAPVLEWLLGPASVSQCAPPLFRICPACAAERTMRRPSLLMHVAGCVEHGLAYVDHCRCSEPIRPFLGQRAFACSGFGCELRYDQLEAAPLSNVERIEVARVSAVYRELARLAPSAPRVGDAAHLQRALRTLVVGTSAPGQPDRAALRWRVNGRPGLRTVADVLLATGSGAVDLARALEETRSMGKAKISGSHCPNPSCDRSDLVRFTAEKQCRTCGTRFNAERVLFSFDEQPGYRAGFGRRNDTRLERHRARLRSICDTWLSQDRSITRESALQAARIPPSSVPHLSRRAGLVAIIDDAQARQLRARLDRANQAAAAISSSDPDLRLRVELLAMAHAIGVAQACKRYGVQRSRFYRWKAAHKRDGIAGLKATCPITKNATP